MMKEIEKKNHIDSLLALVLFGSFALCILFVLLHGVGIYQRLNVRGEEAYNQRTAVQYIVTQVHQADRIGAVYLASVGDRQALALEQLVEDKKYVTYIYHYEGFIREAFVAAESEIEPSDGTVVMPAESLSFALTEGLLTVTIGQDGESLESKVAIRSDGGGA